MNSMTGYGKAHVSGACGEWLVECSSVNRKHLEVAAQLPKELMPHEPLLRAEVAAKVRRGRVAIAVSKPAGAPDALPRFRPEAALAAFKELESFRKAVGLRKAVSIDALIHHPAVFAPPDCASHSGETLWEEMLPAIRRAIDSMVSMRAAEGKAIEAEIAALVESLSRCRDAMAGLAPGVPAKHRKLILERIEAANLPERADDGRLALEIALFADRCDITEELARLSSHIAQFLEKMHSKEPMGRTLEFLVQEMVREVNTAGAKASDAQISALVIEAKTILEKIREQLSNVE